MSSQKIKAGKTASSMTSSNSADVDPEMLQHLNLLVNYDSLDSEDLWDDFVKNFSDFDQDIQEETEKELENENQ